MKKILFVISILLLLTIIISSCLAREYEIYNGSWDRIGNIEKNRKIYDNGYNLKYRIEDNKIYDNKYHLKYRVEDNKIYDDKYHLKYRIEGNKVYDNKYHLKYRIKK